MKHFLPVVFFLLIATITTAQSSNWSSSGSSKTKALATNTIIQVFPNPATSYFSLTEIDNVKQVLVFNLVGRKMKQFTEIAKDKQYFIGDLPKGMYLVQMLNKQEKIITTRRISKR